MDTMALDTNRSTTGGAVRGGYARSRSWRARIRRREWFFGRPEAGKWVRSTRLRTPVRRAIIPVIAHLTPTQIASAIPPPETGLSRAAAKRTTGAVDDRADHVAHFTAAVYPESTDGHGLRE